MLRTLHCLVSAYMLVTLYSGSEYQLMRLGGNAQYACAVFYIFAARASVSAVFQTKIGRGPNMGRVGLSFLQLAFLVLAARLCLS